MCTRLKTSFFERNLRILSIYYYTIIVIINNQNRPKAALQIIARVKFKEARNFPKRRPDDFLAPRDG